MNGFHYLTLFLTLVAVAFFLKLVWAEDDDDDFSTP